MNILGILAAVASIVAFAATYRWLRSRAPATRLLYLGGFLLLSVPALLFDLYYLHLLPEWAWFYALRSWTGSEFLAVPLGGAGAAVASLLPRVLLPVCLAGAVFAAAAPYLKPVLAPLPEKIFQERSQGVACLQSTASTCGPASVTSILRYLGGAASEHDIARAAYSNAGGTEAWYLARYVRRCGFSPRFDFRSTFTPETGLPAVVGVRFGPTGHFIAVLDIRDGIVTVADPLRGEEHVPLAEFRRRYDFTGFHLVIGRG
jgi:hypothetical protein